MTREENTMLRQLLENKMKEYRYAIEYVEDRCACDGMPKQAQEETHGLRIALHHALKFAYQLRDTDDNFTEITLEHIRTDIN